MTTNDFGSLAEERDREFARKLYHNFSLVRLASREWIMAELKELRIESTRLRDQSSVPQREKLDQLTDRVDEIEAETQSKFSQDDTEAFEAARNSNFAHVHEPATNMLSEFAELVAIVDRLRDVREGIEGISRVVDP